MSWKVEYYWESRKQVYELLIRQYAGPGRMSYVTNLEFKTIDTVPGQLVQEIPVLELAKEDAEDFMRAFANAAWRMGIKPTEFKDDNSELKAVKHHLGDMREIVASTLDVELKKSV